MCGIAGILECSNQDSRINLEILKSMSDVIIHRGPDSDGQWISRDRSCGLAFRRLAIIDLSPAGSQPMHSNDGRWTIVFNGEIYNHEKLRQELIAKGYTYNSKCDTETILNGYIEWGKEIVNKLFGMWAFAIWDEEKKELFCSRDRIGIKPLYYTFQNGRFIFGSEIKSILRHPSISPEFNIEELPIYLNHGMSGNRSSLFKNINKLGSGHYLTINKTGNINIERYWSPINKDSDYLNLSEKEICDELINKLRISIKDRMMSDVPFGVFLSGGIDSSLNVALMAELMNRPVDTFTVGFKELEKYNELEYARIIAKKFNTNHHEILIDHNDSIEILDKLVWYEDEPNADPVCIPLYFLSKLAKDSGTTVVQVGEGSDEQFVGYQWMLQLYNFYNSYWKLYTSLPKLAKKLIYNSAKPILNPIEQNLLLDYLRRGVLNEPLYWSGLSMFGPTNLYKLLNKEFHYLAMYPAFYAQELYKQVHGFRKDADFLQEILYMEQQNRIAEILLMRVDKIGMAHSIEARVPFLDHRIVEFSMRINPKQKVPNKNITKYVLKKAVKGIIPDEIIYRKKQGFAAPVKEWMRTYWFGYCQDTILNSAIHKQNYFNKDYINKLLIEHKTGKRNHTTNIFTLLTLCIWYDKYFK